jgi:hypothetical protein
VQVWVRKCASFEEARDADREFWSRMTPDARVAAVGELRAHWAAMQGDDDQRLRRTVRVLKRARG